ncbi:hypothetical protein BO78DRAFT_34283 [Aspergillus sclerotiicarbonarius CBS 121057]|uniref:Uncharacterized protein n=1 Tax=Aspergillus sclerotiicarbonarius (strain CBS 121057 / IBT 28362) TaxID=1448318 RepID=A0A319DSV4_ASPSB|nr:hypothetical protein BO78DRAFT_34283 [Aspergillus sclerotiicarbonarius CBS 121057]
MEDASWSTPCLQKSNSHRMVVHAKWNYLAGILPCNTMTLGVVGKTWGTPRDAGRQRRVVNREGHPFPEHVYLFSWS